jgi:ribosomal protein S21|tara:strand:- start:5291 stop:5554 length:264 start_codon:yes stop_codon:yes gene_type:complete
MAIYQKNRREEKKQFGNGLSVEVRNGNVEQAIRKLKKMMMKDGIMQTVRERRYFVSNTEKRLKAKAAGKARRRREIAKDSIVRKRLY